MIDRVGIVDLNSLFHSSWNSVKPPETETAAAVCNRVRHLAERFDRLVLCIDWPAPGFRREIDPNYPKPKRREPEFLSQFQEAVDTLITNGFPAIMRKGYEADDGIASVVSAVKALNVRSEDHAIRMTIISDDFDLAQLVGPGPVDLFRPHALRTYTPVDIEAEPAGNAGGLGVRPSQVGDLVALVGKEGVPGVPRVGQKTAIALLRKYGFISGVLEAARLGADPMFKPALKKALTDPENIQRLSKSRLLMNLRDDISIDLDDLLKPRSERTGRKAPSVMQNEADFEPAPPMTPANDNVEPAETITVVVKNETDAPVVARGAIAVVTSADPAETGFVAIRGAVDDPNAVWRDARTLEVFCSSCGYAGCQCDEVTAVPRAWPANTIKPGLGLDCEVDPGLVIVTDSKEALYNPPLNDGETMAGIEDDDDDFVVNAVSAMGSAPTIIRTIEELDASLTARASIDAQLVQLRASLRLALESPRVEAVEAPAPRPSPTFVTRIELAVPDATYHADPCEVPSLSAHIAGVLSRQSPLHAWHAHPKLGGAKRKPTKELDAGAVAHLLILGRGAEVEVVDAESWRRDVAKAARDKARAEGKIPVLLTDYEEARVAADAIKARFGEFNIDLAGDIEATFFWTEETEHGRIQCRGRMDHVKLEKHRATVTDLKSCFSAHPDAIQKHIDMYRYDVQRAAYVRAIEENAPHLAGRIDYTLVFCELEAPYVIVPVKLSGEFRALGERRWRRACETWARCLETGVWPGYSAETIEVAPPEWTLTKDLREEFDQ